MKKVILTMMLGILALSMVMAVKPTPASDNGLAHPGKAAQLYLYEKDSSTWNIVEGGAWGKMMFKDNSFVFNGHALVPGEDYTLIYYPDPWPGNGLMLLGSGMADEGGNIHISGEFDFTEIPVDDGDNNYPDGAKIWLVRSSDVDEDNHKMIGWHQEEYLFEYNLI